MNIIHTLRHLKEELALAWGIDKGLWIINNIIFITVIPLKTTKSCFKFKMLYVLLVVNSNVFEIIIIFLLLLWNHVARYACV